MLSGRFYVWEGSILYTPVLLRDYFDQECDIEYFGEHFSKVNDFLVWRDKNVHV